MLEYYHSVFLCCWLWYSITVLWLPVQKQAVKQGTVYTGIHVRISLSVCLQNNWNTTDQKFIDFVLNSCFVFLLIVSERAFGQMLVLLPQTDGPCVGWALALCGLGSGAVWAGLWPCVGWALGLKE